jgi:hypothetical protein
MILLTASRTGTGYLFNVARSGRDTASTENEFLAVRMLTKLGVRNPAALLTSAKRSGCVQIRDEAPKDRA